jgi:metallo-beta-lactamase class B
MTRAQALIAYGSLLAICGATVVAQQTPDTVEGHVAAAKAFNEQGPTPFFLLCSRPSAAAPAPARGNAPATDRENQSARSGGGRGAGGTRQTPDRSRWASDPVKVFDNLFYVGDKEISSWAVVTAAGIIIIDPIWDYNVEEQVVGGLRKLGFDPANIKYVVVSHGHVDHVGGAWFLQDRFKARVLMSAADWDLLEHTGGSWPKARRDLIVTDGQTLTLGDTTLTMYATPGHTPGTISTLIPVRDGGARHVAALWGGTGFNFTMTREKPAAYWYDEYAKSAEHFRDMAAKAGADVILSNHKSWDDSELKMAALARRTAGQPNPYVIGAQSVQRHLTIASECAKAGRLK